METKEIIKNALNGEFSDFKKNVETYLKNKISNNQQVKSISDQTKQMEQISKTFKEIQQK